MEMLIEICKKKTKRSKNEKSRLLGRDRQKHVDFPQRIQIEQNATTIAEDTTSTVNNKEGTRRYE